MGLTLDDLQPAECTFELSEKPGKTYTLKKFSLSARIWMNKTYSKEQIAVIFQNECLPEISEIVYYLLKDKTDFPYISDFQDSVVTQKDLQILIVSLLKTIGMSEPLIKRLADEEEKKSLLIGEQSTMSSPQNTDTPLTNS